MDIEKYLCFPASYAEGRKWFLKTAKTAGAEITTAINPHAKGPEGEELATDMAWFGPADAERVFVSISGTHGQEYFCGAAGQLHWMLSDQPSELPEGVAVCLIHAHNPYGAAYHSRCNENFVDLNRNYFDPGTTVRPNRLYDALYEILSTKEISDHIVDDTMAAFYDFVEKNDTKEAMTAMGGGQDSHSDGLLYCGTGDEWSTENLRKIARDHLSKAEKVALIDWHTGLGEYGELTVLNDLDQASDEYRWACAWWSGPEASEALLAREDQPDYIGHVHAGLAADIRAHGAQVVDAVMEIGTVDNHSVLGALLIDRWLQLECTDTSSPHAVNMRTKMLERLNPSLYSWRQAVLDKTADMYARSIRGLVAWT